MLFEIINRSFDTLYVANAVYVRIVVSIYDVTMDNNL